MIGRCDLPASPAKLAQGRAIRGWRPRRRTEGDQQVEGRSAMRRTTPSGVFTSCTCRLYYERNIPPEACDVILPFPRADTLLCRVACARSKHLTSVAGPAIPMFHGAVLETLPCASRPRSTIRLPGAHPASADHAVTGARLPKSKPLTHMFLFRAANQYTISGSNPNSVAIDPK